MMAVFEFPLPDPFRALQRLSCQPFFFLRAYPDGRLIAALRPVRVAMISGKRGSRLWARIWRESALWAAAAPDSADHWPLAAFLGFEAGAWFETAPPPPRPATAIPDAAAAVYDLWFEWREGRARIVSHGLWRDRAGVVRVEAERARRRAVALRAALMSGAPPARSRRAWRGRIRPRPPIGGYERAVAKLIGRVAAGDLFQANLSWPFRAVLAAKDEPFTLFHRLTSANPAEFAAFLRLPKGAILSHSPELFLAATPAPGGGRLVKAAPIKGTTARASTPEADRAAADRLLGSEKDRAENRMIVDLMRNDLARVAGIGTVAAPVLFALKSLTYVHHLVSEVTAVLRTELDFADLIAACFPPGSVTGAPKPAALAAIARAERSRRGPYCGALVWGDGRDGLSASVLIRTFALTRRGRGEGAFWRGEVRAGGGVTIGSTPAAEAAEIRAKLSAIRAAIEGRRSWL